MHRFLALVAFDAEHPNQIALRRRCAARFADWSVLLGLETVEVRVRMRAPSRLGSQTRGPQACIIGRDFGSSDDPPEFPSTWGPYVSFEMTPTKALHVRRDPTGRIDCWRWPVPGGELLFSHLEDALALDPAPVALNWDYLLYHLHCHFMRGQFTGLANVLEVLPGAEISYRRDQVAQRFFWNPHAIAAQPYDSEAVSARQIRQAADAATSAYGSLYGRIALDLSGGLDSSIVLGLLRRAEAHPEVVGINYVTPHAEGDERAYAREAADLHGVRLIEKDLRLEGFDADAGFVDRLLRPSSRMMPMGYDQLQQDVLDEVGADAFFTGSGGDHLFAASLAAEAGADHLLALGLEGFGQRAHAIANLSGDTIWNVIGRSAVLAARAPQAMPRTDLSFLSAEARAATGAERFIHPWLLSNRSTPPGKLQQIGSITELYRHYWRYGRADLAEENHPLFSQPLMEACLRTPSYFFSAGGLQRGLARRAFSDLLPASIRERRSKGANTSHWVRTLTSNLSAVRDLLLDGELNQRGWLDRAALEQTLSPLGLVANRRLGSLVTCLTTEMWIQGATGRSPSLQVPPSQA